jgi:hypothetical protein
MRASCPPTTRFRRLPRNGWKRTSVMPCAGCHASTHWLSPEHYDSTGRWRELYADGKRLTIRALSDKTPPSQRSRLNISRARTTGGAPRPLS